MPKSCESWIRKIAKHLSWLAGSIKVGVLALVQCKGEFQELVHIFVIFQFEAHISYCGHSCSLGAPSKLLVKKAKASWYLQTLQCCGMFVDEEFREIINFVTTLWSLVQF